MQNEEPSTALMLYIIRHGDPDYKNDRLTERGRRQAAALVPRLLQAGITDVFTSPKGRARETAAPLAAALGVEPVVLDWAREFRHEEIWTTFPDGEPKHCNRIPGFVYRAEGNEDVPFADALRVPPFAAANLEGHVARIREGSDALLASLGYRREGGVYRIERPSERRVAVFCHGDMGRAWISHLLHIPMQLLWAGFSGTHTGVTLFRFCNETQGFTVPRCLFFSDMSHLYAAGEEMLYIGQYPV